MVMSIVVIRGKQLAGPTLVDPAKQHHVEAGVTGKTHLGIREVVGPSVAGKLVGGAQVDLASFQYIDCFSAVQKGIE